MMSLLSYRYSDACEELSLDSAASHSHSRRRESIVAQLFHLDLRQTEKQSSEVHSSIHVASFTSFFKCFHAIFKFQARQSLPLAVNKLVRKKFTDKLSIFIIIKSKVSLNFTSALNILQTRVSNREEI